MKLREEQQNSPTSSSASPQPDSEAYTIRAPTMADAEAVGLQTHHSFNNFNESVGLPFEFPTRACTIGLMTWCIQHSQGLIAVRDRDGEVLGSVFNDECDLGVPTLESTGSDEGNSISTYPNQGLPAAVRCGPWSAAWSSRNAGVGRALLHSLISQSLRHGAKSLRLIQVSSNNASLSLYTSLGFESREPVAMWSGRMKEGAVEEVLKKYEGQYQVRPLTLADVADCDSMHMVALGITRAPSMRRELMNKESKVQRW